jgi:hypothetical protein
MTGSRHIPGNFVGAQRRDHGHVVGPLAVFVVARMCHTDPAISAAAGVTILFA